MLEMSPITSIFFAVVILTFALGSLSSPLERHIANRLKRSLGRGENSDRADFYGKWADITAELMGNDQLRAETEYQPELLKEGVAQYATGLDDPSQVPFTCPIMKPSASVPQSVHALRPGDIGVVAALGDSITAGNGVRSNNLPQVAFPNRGESFSVGGERSLSQGVITLTNILRKYNRNVTGASYCAVMLRSRKFRYHGYNVAIPGAKSWWLESQAAELITRLSQDRDLFYNKWKVVTLLIGGNDMCQHCSNATGRYEDMQPAGYALGIQKALDLMLNHLPKVFVNVVAMLDISFLPNAGGPQCRIMHSIECPCLNSTNGNVVKEMQQEYFRLTNEVVDDPRYHDTRDDFTVVMQPFLFEQTPFTLENGNIDMSFFAQDCFHPSVKSHQLFAIQLWNTMLTPIGQKPTKHNQADPVEYKCPMDSNPYFYTSKNS